MANKAVLLTAGLGLAAYYAGESLKEREIEREAEEARQQQQDRIQAARRRRAEDEYKNKRKFRGNAFAKETERDMQLSREIDNELFELLMRLEKRLKSRLPSSSLTLPLLSSSNNTSQVLLGAAIALGDHDLVRAIQLRIKHSPGLGLATLSKESVQLIQDVFESTFPQTGLTAAQFASRTAWKFVRKSKAWKSCSNIHAWRLRRQSPSVQGGSGTTGVSRCPVWPLSH